MTTRPMSFSQNRGPRKERRKVTKGFLQNPNSQPPKGSVLQQEHAKVQVVGHQPTAGELKRLNLRHQHGLKYAILRQTRRKAAALRRAAAEEMQKTARDQLELYRDTVLERVAGRFDSRAAAEEWFETQPVPGYGKTAKQMVEEGLASKVITVINAIEAGVHA